MQLIKIKTAKNKLKYFMMLQVESTEVEFSDWKIRKILIIDLKGVITPKVVRNRYELAMLVKVIQGG